MGDLLNLRNLFWAATTLAEIVLLLYLVRRKLVDSHLWLVLYLCCTVLQSALAAVMYSLWDFNAPVTRSVIWGSQAVWSSPCASLLYARWLVESSLVISASGRSLNEFS